MNTTLAGLVATLAFIAFLFIVGGGLVFTLLSRSAATFDQLARVLG